MNVDDILYFTGMVEEFGQFCEHHGLEVVTNENEADKRQSHAEEKSSSNDFLNTAQYEEDLDEGAKVVKFASTIQTTIADTENEEQLPLTIETVMPSPLRGSTHNAEGEKVRAINRMRGAANGKGSCSHFMSRFLCLWPNHLLLSLLYYRRIQT